MPHINRLRVNNVKYNFGTQSYEDFIMKPFCRNTLYDLANGGGKSVLMLLLLQNVIPNCTLDEKQPVEKLFRTGDGSQTIHSLIEWRLDDADVVNGFKYMTTGFCARKAQGQTENELNKETASIEYFNYCIFYRSYNENDIRNLPLIKNGEKITYPALKKYLKDLEHDNSLIVKVFDRKGEYQAFISEYGLYESEWEIIRGINKTEGHVRAYFESNYKTTRKVVEDLLIEEIIQKSFKGSGENDSTESMSKTLLDMKDRLAQLSKKRSEIKNFGEQMRLLDEFALRLEGIGEIYERKLKWENELIKAHKMSVLQMGYGSRLSGKKDEEISAAIAKENELSQKIDAARLYDDKRTAYEIKEKLDRLTAEQEKIKEEISKKESSLSFMESTNDYLEYQDEKRKRDEVSEAVNALEGKNGGILDELKFLAWHRHERLKKELERLSKEEQEFNTGLDAKTKEADYIHLKQREAEKELAAAKGRITVSEESKKKLEGELKDKLADAGIMFAQSASEEASKEIESLSILMSDTAVLKGNLEKVKERLDETSADIIRSEQEESGINDLISKTEQEVNEYSSSELRIDKLLKAYGKDDVKGLLAEIRERHRYACADRTEFEREIAETKKQLEGLNKGEVPAGSEAAENIAENINALAAKKELQERKIKISAVTGTKYLQGLTDELKERLIKEVPYIAASVIIKDGFDVVKDSRAELKYDLETAVPVISELLIERILKTEENNAQSIIMSGDMFIAAKVYPVYIGKEELKSEIKRFEEKIKHAEFNRQRSIEMEKVYAEDEDFAHAFMLKYENELPAAKLDSLKKELQRISSKKLELSEKRTGCCHERDELIQKINYNEAMLEDINEKIECLKHISLLADDIEACENDISKLKEQEKFLEEKLAEYESEAEKLSLTREELARQLNIRLSLEKDLKKEWQDNYSVYFEEGEYKECTLKDDELAAQFAGKKMAVLQEHAELDDKKRLVNSYVNAMNYCLKNISRRGSSISELSNLYEEKKLYKADEKVIEKLKDELEALNTDYNKRAKLLNALKEDYVRLEGKTSHEFTVMKEKYGEFTELTELNEDVEQLIENARKQIKEQIKLREMLFKEKDKLEGDIKQCEEIKKDIERIIKTLSTQSIDENKDAAWDDNSRNKPDINELKKIYEVACENYEMAANELGKRRTEFEKHKEQLIEDLKRFGAYPLADEVKKSVTMPENSDETSKLAANLREVNECISLERERLEKSTKEMADIRANFESQCLQRCLNIKSELDRLSRLSRINLDGEQIQMISLSVPYIKEEMYSERMETYIDSIVDGVADFEVQAEKLKFIRQSLSLKKLFSVIVTDMNDIKLSLYKRERIKEQSRHLRYEEAVGSTGQSQGIYIQFLISLINYISSINSGRGDTEGLRKVIFIDNPFGAAKDVYIWEPIFELLKTNHVQLIVPARGTTPAITGRFDVNYVLGQKLVDGRQQTVVVDYRSQIDTSEAEYVPLMYEQTSLEF